MSSVTIYILITCLISSMETTCLVMDITDSTNMVNDEVKDVQLTLLKAHFSQLFLDVYTMSHNKIRYFYFC